MVMCAVVYSTPSKACSRVVLRSDSTNVVMVGRTLDWRSPIPTNVYIYPAGMSKVSMPSGARFEWVSKYGSAIAVGYDGGVTEGINEKGLVMNGLFCKGSVYREVPAGSDVPVMSLAVIVSYFLDNFANVDEVEQWLHTTDFGIAGKTFDGGTVSLLHWAFTDASGKTLIMEFDDGKLNLYSSKDYQVLTNDPQFEQMQAIDSYWQSIGGENMLPGGVRSSDRFVRGSYFVRHVPLVGRSPEQYLTQIATIMDNLSVPYGYEVDGQPNLSSTQWRSIADINNLRYYMRFADSLAMFYVDLRQVKLSPEAPVLKLDTTERSDLFGNVTMRMKTSKPFTPMW